MKHHQLARRLAAAGAALLMTAAALPGQIIQPVTVYAGQQLGQTDFENGVGLPWHIVESTAGKMEFEIDNGVYKVTIVSPGGASRGGEDRWDCQFRHRGLKIVAGHQYRVQYQITPSNAGKYYTKIGNLEGNVEVWHNMSNGYDLDQHWDCIQIGANETKSVDLTFTAGQTVEVAEWAFHLGGDGQYTQGDCFPAGTVITFDNMSLIDLTSDENDYKAPEQWNRAEILTDQVGYFSDRAKRATMLCTDKDAVDVELIDDSGKSVWEGKSQYFGFDEDSGDTVHTVDFTDFDGKGKFHLEASNGAKSREFTVGDEEIWSGLVYDSLNYFYQNRSGIEIKSEYITSGDKNALARAAGHPSDNAEIQQTWGYNGSSGSVDVTGGWYDAGDHGKYVVNGGFSLWMMQNQYEAAKALGLEKAFADGTMALPECSNGYPDLLDEARYEMEWMFKMIVDSGEYAGMAYHKAHDETWTGLGVAPADDDKKRIIKPPTTAATLNLSACAAQAARLWKGIDDEFAEKCLEKAKLTYEAAKKHPKMYAPLDESVGGGAYGDNNVEDEFCWAAMELFITTGDEDYFDETTENKFFLAVPTSLGGGESVDTVGSFDWGNVGALGTLSAALNPDRFDTEDKNTVAEAVKKAADHYLDMESKQGYGQPYGQSTLSYNDSDKGYIWGSNSFVADNAIVLSYAYLMTKEDKYLDGAIGGLDYLLGRNAMDYSYVTGYGTHTTEFPHHRYWSYQIDQSFPKAPCGVMAGGPNSGMQDPWVQGMGWKKGSIAPMKCYLDNVEAWSVNECTINWNASLAWLSMFVTGTASEIKPGSTGSTAGVENNGGEGKSNDEQTYDESEAERNAEKAKVTKKSDSKGSTEKETASEEASEGGMKTWVIVLIVIAGVVVLISIEVFIFEMVKLNKQTKK
ncbi:Carbohydrate binding domain-containing protein [Ruminococcaceae bacterium FB2012]|nr:Carbohydrate binding domain-containing protein [Ruminococcaceae bacterium FB2012]